MSLVLADPPYNVGKRYGDGFVDAMAIDDYRRFCREWWTHSMSRAQRVVVTPGPSNLPYWATLEPSWVYCWQTASNTPGGRAAMRLGWEPIVSFGFPLRPLGTDIINYAIGKQDGCNGHPCAKPLGLFTAIIERWTDEGDLVCDPFGGSGTTAVACKLLNRRCVSIDIDEAYCAAAVRRLRQGVLAFSLDPT